MAYYASVDNKITIEEKSESLGVSVGEFLEYCWAADLMPHPGESKAMKRSIKEAIEDTLFTGSVTASSERLGLHKETMVSLLTYRGERKVRFFKDANQLQTVYELFKAQWGDQDIGEALQIEIPYISVITDLFFKRKQDHIGFQAR